jgi:hypothetical protein
MAHAHADWSENRDYVSPALAFRVPAGGMVSCKFPPFIKFQALPDALRLRPHLVHDDGGIGTQLPQPRTVLLDERH